MSVTISTTNKPLNPRAQDLSPKGYNRASLYSGKALDFDGVNDSVSVSYSETLGGVWSWVSIIEFDSVSGYQELFGGQYGTTNATIYLKNTQLAFYTNQDNLNTAFDFETGKKYHVACSQSGDTISVFVNGQAAGSVSLTIPLNSTSGTYIVGKRPNQANEYFNGKISGVKLFNTALTAAQVSDLYLNPEKIVPDGVANSALKLWLPMMEGAGTTAYDGSGNGNHGTINGATWVSGIGAPVAQTALVSWNKGTNLYPYSSQLNQWTASFATVTANYAVSPDGYTNADRVQFTAGGLVYISGSGSAGENTLSVYAKATNGTSAKFRFFGNGTTILSSDQTATGEWQRFTFTYTYSAQTAGLTRPTTNGGVDDVLFYGFQHEIGSSATSYIPTLSTAQTTPVLLPQGLTTGRDITGVNLFENVRNAFALNLDGKSWAEVHDNASLDVSEITAEGWMYMEDITSLDTNRIVIKWNTTYPERTFQLYATGNSGVWMLSNGSAAYLLGGGTFTQGQWYHIVGTYDGTTQRLYVNGSQVNSAALSITLKQSSKELMIGGYSTGVYSNNSIALPRIYNRALTATEVSRNYNADRSKFGL